MAISYSILALALFFVLANGLNHRHVSNTQNKMHVIERFNENDFSSHLEKLGTIKLKKFVWSTCSGPDAMARINELEVSDPLSVPGNVTVTIDSVLSGEVKTPLKVGVEVQKKVGFLWVDVPCVDNVGSCNYDDLCASIPFPPGEPCPEPFLTLGLPCNCPVAQGDYIIKNKMVHIPDEHIPQFLARGQYNVRVQASVNGREVICFKSTFSLV